ncbi:MAG: hypothetical protein JO183_06035 [Ktedonobacteraceae bacterium]|nr:hypothetical protein [Ktedonobacteraceae bacterium]MBV9021900.1 hypothetical protein [Ktedonobacteraceae bacterium]
MTTCPQCGTENEDNVKNCKRCRVNMYWAFQHYEELASLRQASQLPPSPQSASFLVNTSSRIDDGPTAGWLHNTIKKFGFKEAGKKVCTTTE